MAKVLVIAGEASGDLHAASVVRSLRRRRDDLQFFGIAGPALRREGVEAVARVEQLSVMGLTAVLAALPRILRIMRRVTQAARERKPDLAILVDSPDLNLRMARRLKKLGVPVLYFIGPTVWAWREGRVEQVRRWVDRMLVILPFEESFYTSRGVAAKYVGHPLLDDPQNASVDASELNELRDALGLTEGSIKLALLPGSRRAEIERCLPTMLDAAARLRKIFPGLVVLLPVAPTLGRAELERHVAASAFPEVKLVDGRARAVLELSDAAVIVSGTAVLEAALACKPMVVVYRASWATWLMVQTLVHTPHMALANIVAGRRVVPELFQGDMDAGRIAEELATMLPGGARRDEIVAGLREVKALLGEPGAADRVAEAADELLGRAA